MKVVIVGMEFKEDVAHLALLAGEVELVLYGQEGPLRGQAVAPGPPPTFCKSRTLRPVAVTPRGPLVWYYPELGRALSADQPDLVHAIAEPWRPVAAQAAAWSRDRDGKTFVVSTADRNWQAAPAFERFVRGRLTRRTLEDVNGLASESQAGVDEAVRFGLPPGAVTAVIHTNPRDPTVFRPPVDAAERERARSSLGLPIEGIGVGFIARLRREKGPELFLDAIDRLPERSDVWAAVAGTGPLESEVRRRALAPNLHYLGELDFRAQVADLYRAVDILVVPSIRVGRWEEQGPRAVIEGMLSGCAVVGTNVGAIPEMLGDTGVVVEPEAQALADGIVASFGRDGSAGRRRALERYSSEAVARQLLDFWRHARNHRNGR